MIMDSQDGVMSTHQAVLEHLRQNNTKIKSYDEIVNLLHVIASEQKTKTLIRSCMDKVLINMSDIHSLREMIERLRSVARTNGLRFHMPFDESAGSSTTCMITGDMFKVEVSLSGQDSNFCHDVRVYHSEHPKSCPELLQIIREGKFLKLSEYLKSLIDMYPINMDRHTKTRVYMTLQSLEMDISKMSQIYKESHTDCPNLQIVNHGTVGLLAPHAIGKNLQLNYFLSPYDLIDSDTKQLVTAFDNMPNTKGLHAEIKVISQETMRTLPISPLISNNHPIDGTGKPRFAEVNQHNSISLPACFIMKLCPPVILTAKVAAEIQAETGIPVITNTSEVQGFVSLVVKEGMCSQTTFDEHTHRYHLGFENIQALTVEEIRFTHPGHVSSVLTLLRKQAYFNTIISSCIRPKKQSSEKERAEWYFDISTDKHFTKLNVIFEHPLCSSSTAFAEILFSSEGFSACHLFTGRGDPSLCTDQYATKVLQKSYSLPITMRYLMKQTKQQPRKEPDRSRLPPLRSSMLHPTAPKKLSTPKPPVPSVQPPAQYTSPQKQSPTTSVTTTPEPPRPDGGKETNHPMLTSLLKPSHDPPKPSASTVQTKKHPMLLDLLNDRDTTGNNNKTTTSVVTAPKQVQPFQQTVPDLSQHYNTAMNTIPQSMQGYFNQQPSVNPMPPPPSYPTSMSMKPVQQSPLGLDDIPSSMTASMTSPGFNAQPNVGGPAMTPPLMPVHSIPPSPNTPSMPSPSMYTVQSPMQPPMNTPQSLAMTSPMHPAMTPPLPSPRKVGRRQSRTKSYSTEVSSNAGGFMDIKTELPDFNFDDADFFNPGTSPSAGGFIGTKLVSPNQSRGDLSSFSNFSFDSDFGLDSDRSVQRRNSYGRRHSGQAYTPQPVVKQESQEYPPDITQQQGMQQQQQFRPIFPNYQQNMNQYQTNQMGGVESQDDHNVSIRTPTSVGRSFSQSSEQLEVDPFKFDDNKKPSTISMSDSGVNLQRSGSLSRQSSSSSVIGEDSTLKGLLIGQIPGSNGNKAGMNKLEKQPGVLHNLLTKNPINTTQRRGSEEAMTSQQSLGGHKPLVRQNAISKPATMKTAVSLPAKPGDAKDKTRKRAAGKDEANKGPPKRRGRPPSTDKKEHSGKRKKLESGADDSEVRGKIVLNVQLNKGTPISSSTKTKPIQPETPNATDKVPPAAPPVPPNGQGASTEIGKYSPDLQRYFKTQMEMEKKKKDKLVGGSASPVAAVQVKGNGKFPTPPSVKASANGAKTLGTAVPKGQISPQQKAAAPRPRKGSINDVVKMLHGQTSAVPTTTKTPQAGVTGPARIGPNVQGPVPQKASVKSPASAENPGLPKLKPIGVQAVKIGIAKPPPKPTSILKQGSSKSPSHSSKPAGGNTGPPGIVGRVPQPTKKDPKQPRPVTPQRDEKGGFFSSPPLSKAQMPANLLVDPKLKNTLNRINETAAATTKHNLPPNSDVAKQRTVGIGRPSSGGKSPGRSITPPHAKAPFPGGIPEVLLYNDARVAMKGRKSPAHAMPPIDAAKSGGETGDERSITPRSSTAPTSHSRKSSTSESVLSAPPAKRHSISPAPAPVPRPPSATESPASPDDQLIIDDETAASKINRSVTPVQAVAVAARGSSPVVRAPQTNDGASSNVVALMKKGSSDFELSLVGSESPCLIDDALMDEAVS